MGGGNELNQVVTFSCQRREFSIKSNFPFEDGRLFTSLCIYSDRLYVVGGLNGKKELVDTAHYLDIGTDSWT